MKRKIQIIASFILTLIISTSCIFMEPSLKGNGNVVEDVRKTGTFDEIKVSRGMNVYISQGNKTSVVVKADENLLDAIETNIEGNTLKILSSRNIRKATSKKVFVTVPDISVIKSSSGSNVFSETVLKTEKIEISSSSGSNMKLDVDIEKIEASASSGSNIKLKGSANSFTSKASSGSNIKAGKLITKNCVAKVSSGANTWVNVKESFEGDASSGGNLYYIGNPKTINIKKSSGGNIRKD